MNWLSYFISFWAFLLYVVILMVIALFYLVNRSLKAKGACWNFTRVMTLLFFLAIPSFSLLGIGGFFGDLELFGFSFLIFGPAALLGLIQGIISVMRWKRLTIFDKRISLFVFLLSILISIIVILFILS